MQWASADRITHESFFEYASQSVLHCGWAKVFVKDQLARGKTYATAALALAFSPERFRGMFVCWRDRVPYDETTYRQSLHRLASHPARKLNPQPPQADSKPY